MAQYDHDNRTDGEGATKNMFDIRLECDTRKIKLWFQVLENIMQFAQIHAQWTKLQGLPTVLPANLWVPHRYHSTEWKPENEITKRIHSEPNMEER